MSWNPTQLQTQWCLRFHKIYVFFSALYLVHFFYRELDEDTGIVEAQNVSMVQSAATNKLASQAHAKFQEFGGEDQEIDAYELQLLLNSVFTKGKM